MFIVFIGFYKATRQGDKTRLCGNEVTTRRPSRNGLAIRIHIHLTNRRIDNGCINNILDIEVSIPRPSKNKLRIYKANSPETVLNSDEEVKYLLNAPDIVIAAIVMYEGTAGGVIPPNLNNTLSLCLNDTGLTALFNILPI